MASYWKMCFTYVLNLTQSTHQFNVILLIKMLKASIQLHVFTYKCKVSYVKGGAGSKVIRKWKETPPALCFTGIITKDLKDPILGTSKQLHGPQSYAHSSGFWLRSILYNRLYRIPVNPFWIRKARDKKWENMCNIKLYEPISKIIYLLSIP